MGSILQDEMCALTCATPIIGESVYLRNAADVPLPSPCVARSSRASPSSFSRYDSNVEVEVKMKSGRSGKSVRKGSRKGGDEDEAGSIGSGSGSDRLEQIVEDVEGEKEVKDGESPMFFDFHSLC